MVRWQGLRRQDNLRSTSSRHASKCSVQKVIGLRTLTFVIYIYNLGWLSYYNLEHPVTFRFLWIRRWLKLTTAVRKNSGRPNPNSFCAKRSVSQVAPEAKQLSKLVSMNLLHLYHKTGLLSHRCSSTPTEDY